MSQKNSKNHPKNLPKMLQTSIQEHTGPTNLAKNQDFVPILYRDQNKENRQGKDLGGVKGYLKGIFGNPSLTKIPRKNQ